MRGFRPARLVLAIAACSLGLVNSADAAFTVTSRADHAPGACTASDCTLREAVLAANAAAGRDVVKLPASGKPYVLTRAGAGEDLAEQGDLDFDGDGVTVRGKSPKKGVIKQTVADRVLDVPDETDGEVTLKNLTITGGDPGDFGVGGGVRTEGDLRIVKSVIKRNTAPLGGGVGLTGALGSDEFSLAALTMEKTTVTKNVAGRGGGVDINANDVPVAIDASTINGNSAFRGGGMMLVPDDGDIEIANSTIGNNKALARDPEPPSALTNGGGIYAIDYIDSFGNIIVEYVTIAQNRAPVGRAGNFFGGNMGLDVENTIIASPVTGLNCAGTDVDSHDYNLDSGTTCGLSDTNDQENATAALGILSRNGGPTKTMLPGLGSSAIGGGDCSPQLFLFHSFDLSVDQRGVARPTPAATTCDVGAVEVP